MRGIAIINDDLYYERTDGTYAKMPYHDPEAVASILIERLTDDERWEFMEAGLRNIRESDPEKASSLLQSLG